MGEAGRGPICCYTLSLSSKGDVSDSRWLQVRSKNGNRSRNHGRAHSTNNSSRHSQNARTGVNIQNGDVAIKQIVAKSQILAGGRGLGTFKSGLQGGVHIVKAEQLDDIAGAGFNVDEIQRGGRVEKAFAPDVLIEGSYDPDAYNPEEGKFIMGLQFHPERMRRNDSEEYGYPGCPFAYQVENILVIGRSCCGGIKGLMDIPDDGSALEILGGCHSEEEV